MTAPQLSDRQWLVLYALDSRTSRGASATPYLLTHEVNTLGESWYGRPPEIPWQGVTRTMASLVARGLAVRHSHRKWTWYLITQTGRAAIRELAREAVEEVTPQ